MEFNEVSGYIPTVAFSVGAILLLWGQKDKIKDFLFKFLPKSTKSPDACKCPANRFATFYALRTWCFRSGYKDAVLALDKAVLPVLVKSEDPPESLSKD